MSKLDDIIAKAQSTDVADEPNYTDREIKKDFKAMLRQYAKENVNQLGNRTDKFLSYDGFMEWVGSL